MTSDEKISLIDDLWASIDFEALELSPEIEAELSRRLDRLDAEGPSNIAWEQVNAEMLRR